MRSFLDGKVTLMPGDCREVLATLPEASVDAIVCDPPYGLVFMGRAWDTLDGAPFAVEFWQLALRVLKPGGHLVAFSGTRTYHRMACAIEDAGFEIRDQLAWVYGSGFPKSLDVSKAIDKAAGAEREIVGTARTCKGDSGNQTYAALGEFKQSKFIDITAPATDAAKQWSGFGTALKPSWEPICLARKPLIGTVAQNVIAHGTGALNIDVCRVEGGENTSRQSGINVGVYGKDDRANIRGGSDLGRWPANLIHDGSEEVIAGFPESAGQQGDVRGSEPSRTGDANTVAYGKFNDRVAALARNDSGSAARFFYTAKADAEDRLGSKHPTVKPVDLMQWLCRLVCPKGGTVLDPFAGTGTTGEAAWREGMKAILIEREPEYQADIARRMELAVQPTKRAAVAKSKNKLDKAEDMPLFARPEAS